MNLLSVITTLILTSSHVGAFDAKPILRQHNGIIVGTTQCSASIATTEINTSPELYDSTTIFSRVFAADKRPVILFDGVCNMCNSAVNLALDWDPKGKLRFSALQSNVGRALLEANGRNADDISSIVLVTSDGAYIKSDAILKITEELTPFSLLPLKPAAALGRVFVPKILRDIIYDGVADNRYSIMGKRDECRLDSDGEFENRFVDDRIAVKLD
mmetsp:Transcript_99695/g.277354  ORF Transcript_99695/g.277354 Transcript_99695/m.277354 type:complete len:215 (+) Transcript_99695:30-674(+)